MTKAARRSCLVVPASAPRMLAKATAIVADEIVLDLEDAVLPTAKAQARAAAVAAVADWPGALVAVRVNAPRTPWCHEDVVALAGCDALASIVVPKVESAGDLAFVERLLDGAEAASGRRSPLRVQALIETAAAVANLGEIATATARLDSLILGYADLGAALGGQRELDDWRPIQDAVLVAARAGGLLAIDGPYLATAVDGGFAAATTRARDLGFDGKWAIHPSQIDTLTTAFTPSPEQITHAKAVITALAAAEREGHGTIALDGEMLDEALRVTALRTLARAGINT
jgi:citrate lyase subunit beta/citryl-CoA lyase